MTPDTRRVIAVAFAIALALLLWLLLPFALVSCGGTDPTTDCRAGKVCR